MAADSLVKIRDTNNPLFGAAYYNSEKKRVEENVLDLELLGKADASGFPEIRRLYVRHGGKEEVFVEKPLGSRCVGIERFVFLKQLEEKALAGVVVCGA